MTYVTCDDMTQELQDYHLYDNYIQCICSLRKYGAHYYFL